MQITGPTAGGQKVNSQTRKASGTQESRTNRISNSNVGATNNSLNIPNYFRFGTNKEADKIASRLPMMKIHNEFSNVFTSIDCFKGTFKLQVREGNHPYQAPPRRVAYTLQEPL